MYTRCSRVDIDTSQTINFPTAGLFELSDRQMVQIYIDKYAPESCEYNFANLFAWQEAYHYSWCLYKGRLLVYDGKSQSAFMPLGEPLDAGELADLARHLLQNGLNPEIGLVTAEYLSDHPDVDRWFEVVPERDYAEYIYSAEKLTRLTGTKLHKKRNLIAQFKRACPDYELVPLHPGNLEEALSFSRDLLYSRGEPSGTLLDEFAAIQKAFEFWGHLCMEGLAVYVAGRMVAFSVFSRINRDTYNVQFEKSDFSYKGAAQLINQETARYVSEKCLFINREQDLGLKGLRQAKLSYEPEKLLLPHSLIFKR